MLELSAVDLEEIATALQDQAGWEYCWLIDPQSGQVAFWTEDGGIDGRAPVGLEELDQHPTIACRHQLKPPAIVSQTAALHSPGGWHPTSGHHPTMPSERRGL